jgi:hypothetical protein
MRVFSSPSCSVRSMLPPTPEILEAVSRQQEIRESAERDRVKPPPHPYRCPVCWVTFPELDPLHRHFTWAGHWPLGLLLPPADSHIRCGICSGPSPCLLHPWAHSYRAD